MSPDKFDDAFSDDILAYIRGDSDDNPFGADTTKNKDKAEAEPRAKQQNLEEASSPPPIFDKAKPLKNHGSEDHRHGHRDRLRARFVSGGANAVADYELLELILFHAIPRRDVKPIAKALLARFGSLLDVVNAPIEALSDVKGVGETTAIQLKVIQAACHKILQEQVINKNVISSWQALLDYCKTTMGPMKKEQFRILFLDKKNALIADEVQQEGTIDHTPVYPREVMKRALELHATALILVHNHPSGDPTPSQADIDMTRELVQAGKSLGVVIHDHLIIARHDYKSFRNMGLL